MEVPLYSLLILHYLIFIPMSELILQCLSYVIRKIRLLIESVLETMKLVSMQTVEMG